MPALTQSRRVRVLGIDPGSLRVGWGVVERDGHRMQGLGTGVIRLSAKLALHDRLRVMYRELSELSARFSPDEVAVEDIFLTRDFAQAALKLGQARGAALVALANAGLAISAYPPALVKRAVAGGGRADKQQVARTVMALLRMSDAPPLDATDALAVAITHLNHVTLRPARPAAERAGTRRALLEAR